MSSPHRGLLSIGARNDGEVLEFCQESYLQEPARNTIAEQGGRDWGELHHLITENPLRAMFAYWRKVMEI